jgi:hypothetical protein
VLQQKTTRGCSVNRERRLALAVGALYERRFPTIAMRSAVTDRRYRTSEITSRLFRFRFQIKSQLNHSTSPVWDE